MQTLLCLNVSRLRKPTKYLKTSSLVEMLALIVMSHLAVHCIRRHLLYAYVYNEQRQNT